MLKLTSPWIVYCVLIEWDVKSYALKNRTFDIEFDKNVERTAAASHDLFIPMLTWFRKKIEEGRNFWICRNLISLLLSHNQSDG